MDICDVDSVMNFEFTGASILIVRALLIPKEYVSLIIGLYKNNGSVLHVAIRLFYLYRKVYPVL